MPDPNKPYDEIEDKDLKAFKGSEGLKGTADSVSAALDEEVSKDATSQGGMDRMRERATSKAMGKGYDDPEGRYTDVDGDGGYKYRYLDTGAIRILKAPGGRGEGLLLKQGSGKAYDAIVAELKAKGALGEGSVGVEFGGTSKGVKDEGDPEAGRAKAAEEGLQGSIAASRQKAAADIGREAAQRNAQVATTVEKGKLDTKMAMEEKSRDVARANAQTGTRVALGASEDPEAVMASARAEADRLMKEGSASEAIKVLNDAIDKAKELRSKPQSEDDVVARVVKQKREQMGI